jgi:hypothetical protein
MVSTFKLNRAAPARALEAAPALLPPPAQRPQRAATRGGVHLRPEDVIPLEDDPDFKDF